MTIIIMTMGLITNGPTPSPFSNVYFFLKIFYYVYLEILKFKICFKKYEKSKWEEQQK